jgi:hypothetical protein
LTSTEGDAARPIRLAYIRLKRSRICGTTPHPLGSPKPSTDSLDTCVPVAAGCVWFLSPQRNVEVLWTSIFGEFFFQSRVERDYVHLANDGRATQGVTVRQAARDRDALVKALMPCGAGRAGLRSHRGQKVHLRQVALLRGRDWLRPRSGTSVLTDRYPRPSGNHPMPTRKASGTSELPRCSAY